MVESIYYVLRNFSSIWWIFASFFWLFLNLILAKITPLVIIPIFYKYIPINNEELKNKIFYLFNYCNLKIKDIYAINLSKDTKKANAFVCGVGGSRHIVLSDTLLNNFDNDQINTVVAHELGHYKNRDMIKLILLNSILAFVVFFLVDIVFKKSLILFSFESISDIAFFPLFSVYLLLASLIILPIQNGFSRVLERKADLFSLQVTRSPETYISALTKLGKINLADFSPNRFIEFMFYDHPSLSRRILFIRKFKDKLRDVYEKKT
jgi:STE24 endopeptidase